MRRSPWLRFAYRLAKELGIWDVHGMLRQMSVTDLRTWIAYYELEPFGEERADLRSAQIVTTLANIHRKPRTPAARIKDFVLQVGEPARSKSVGPSFEEIKQRARMMAGGS